MLLVKQSLVKEDKKSLDPNVVGFESSSSEEENEDKNDIEENEVRLNGALESNNTQEKIKETTNENVLIETVTSNVFNEGSKNIEIVNKENGTNEEQHVKNENQNPPNDKNDVDKTKLSKNKSSVPEVNINNKTPTVFISVDRTTKIQESRLKLPILGEEQIIMEAINENPVVIIAGETGSGKTTQLPQFLYEAGYASNGKIIGITEPRRVAAISMATRVAEELNLTSEKVSYLIRFEGNTTSSTQIKFMTDGVLLKEVQSDFLLRKYSVIILDEAHERSVYTDILIGLLSRIVPLRCKRGDPLKLIIMSATLRLTDFTENSRLFKITPPVINVESRQFPVTIHFNKRTVSDYVKEAFHKACKIHSQLPEGGILIFLTGQQEVKLLVKKLKNAFPNRNKMQKSSTITDKEVEEHLDDELYDAIRRVKKGRKKKTQISLPEINLDNYTLLPGDDTEGDMLDWDSEEDWEEEENDARSTSQPMWVLPLYSLLPSHKQAQVFNKPPEGYRLCVVSTNVAETSLTIPHVKYVIDCGKTKTRLYDKHTGVSAFDVVWASKAAVNQRAGRAGRTSAGHCYRLYSSAVFNDEFPAWSVPEIQRRPVDELMLQMKALGIQRVINFPFPTAPDLLQLQSAERRLELLGALEVNSNNKDKWNSKLSPLGRTMSAFPVSPRFAKMLCLSHQKGLLGYTVAIVAALSVQEFLLAGDKQWIKTRRKWAGVGNSFLLGDVMVLLKAVGGAEYANTKGNLEKFCSEHGLRHKAVIESRKLRLQLTSELNLYIPGLDLVVDPKMEPPTDIQAKQLRQIILSGMVDQVAKKLDDEDLKTAGIRRTKAAYRTPEMEDVIYLPATSVFAKEKPEWIVYQEIYQTDKMYIRGATAIEPEWLPIFAPTLCNLSPVLSDPPPRYDEVKGIPYCHVTGSFGRSGWPLPITDIEFPPSLDRYRWFALFFLDGSVCPKLKKFTKSLLSTPATMIKTWAKLQSRTDTLLNGFASCGVDSSLKLREQWKENKTYLLAEYLKWLPESAHNQVTIIWPPI
uniref:RNA helicase n=1 Tax=Clastoptera arizonana TaxID=38151 RepID=A0A1B6CYI3_9HEMI